MLRIIRRSISNKLMLVVMSTTFIALLVYGVAMLAYDLRAYHEGLIKDLSTQANIIAEVSAPALEFNDPVTAKENLDLLRTRPSILGASLFTSEGKIFAEYSSGDDQLAESPVLPQLSADLIIDGNRIQVWQPVLKNDQILGSVYILARYEVQTRLANYLIILGCVMGASLGLALLIAIWLRGALTKPVFAVTNVARQVMQSRDFS